MSNKYLKTLAAGLIVLGLSGNTVGQEENQSQPPAQEHSLTSTADAGTTLNEDLAAKVRKVTELIMTKEKGKFTEGKKKVGTRVLVEKFAVNESEGYEFEIYDMHGHDRPGSDSIDSILIMGFYLTENNERKVYAFFDYGLDGNLNVVETYVAPTNNLFPPEGLIDYEFTKEQLKEIKTFRKEVTGEVTYGAEYQETFQREYENVLDKLIKIYETE